MKKEKGRFLELDLIRGGCVLLMIFDHFMFSAMSMLDEFCYMFKVEGFLDGLIEFANYYWHYPPKEVVHYLAISAFLILCGISCTLSRSNLKRGLIALGAGLLITFATSTVERVFELKGLTIYFGVIHMLATSMLIYFLLQLPLNILNNPLEKLKLKRIKTANSIKFCLRLLPSVVGLSLLILYFSLPLGKFILIKNDYGQEFINLTSTIDIDLSKKKIYKDFISTLIMLKNYKEFQGADYFPLLPYGALVLSGGLIGELVYKKRKRTTANPKIIKPITFVGRHALIFYLTHQVVIVAFFFVCVFIRSLI